MRKSKKAFTKAERIYRELDGTFIGAERNQRELEVENKYRYNPYTEMGIDNQGNLFIQADNYERLKFAEEVAKHYKVKFNYIENSNVSKECEKIRLKIDLREAF